MGQHSGPSRRRSAKPPGSRSANQPGSRSAPQRDGESPRRDGESPRPPSGREARAPGEQGARALGELLGWGAFACLVTPLAMVATGSSWTTAGLVVLIGLVVLVAVGLAGSGTRRGGRSRP